ncbi:uncharacterized protein LOC117319139 isoform X1 [Pecten maximus]|uniref:uncharacterized protein LOC117319139 isoform X1 n=1 Tax=Pecten maximus TaxID=6579 RepID=UPI001458507D|nr:uncharacterized protein LOC117319139 isoform X1 [Pecten maximus]
MNTLVALLILGCAVFCVAEGWKVERYRNNKTRIKLGVFMRRSRNDPGYTRGHAQGICKHHKASLITNMRVIRNFGGYLSRRWNKKRATYTRHIRFILTGRQVMRAGKRIPIIMTRKSAFQRPFYFAKRLTADMAFICFKKY